jgi:hypothetical protein
MLDNCGYPQNIILEGPTKARASVQITGTKCSLTLKDVMKQCVCGTRSDKEANPAFPFPDNTSSEMILQLTDETSTELHSRHS